VSSHSSTAGHGHASLPETLGGHAAKSQTHFSALLAGKSRCFFTDYANLVVCFAGVGFF